MKITVDDFFMFLLGMGMLASYYTDPKERTRAFGTALSGLAFGVLGNFDLKYDPTYLDENAN